MTDFIVFFSQSNPSKYLGITRDAFSIVFKAQISSREKTKAKAGHFAGFLHNTISCNFPIIQLFPFTDELTEANLTRALLADSEAHSVHLRTLPTYIYTEYYFLFYKKGPYAIPSMEEKEISYCNIIQQYTTSEISE